MWTKLGFRVDDSGADVFAILEIDGIIITRTKRSHGSGKLDGQIPHFIRQKMFLNERQFARAYKCPLKEPEYRQILQDKGKV